MLATRIEGWDVQIFDRLFLMGGRTAFAKRPCSPCIRKPRFIVCTARYYPRICNHCIPCDTPICNVRTARSSPPFVTITSPFVTPASAATGGLRTAGAGVLADVVGWVAGRRRLLAGVWVGLAVTGVALGAEAGSFTHRQLLR